MSGFVFTDVTDELKLSCNVWFNVDNVSGLFKACLILSAFSYLRKLMILKICKIVGNLLQENIMCIHVVVLTHKWDLLSYLTTHMKQVMTYDDAVL